MLRPINDQVLVRLIYPPTQTDGGIMLSDWAQDHPVTGKVLAVGPGHMDKFGVRHPPALADGKQLTAGMRVVFNKWAATASVYQIDEDVVLMPALEVLAECDKDIDIRPIYGRR